MASGRVVPARRLHRHQPAALCRRRRRLLQPSRYVRAVHQGRQARDQMDPPVMPLLRRQRGAPSASCPCLQSRQFHADAGDAEDGGAVVANQPAREADQDRRKGGEPWALRDLPAGRGRSAATDVRRNPVADRPAARTASASMTENWRRVRQTTTVEVRLGSWQSREFWLREANQTAFLAVTRSAASKFCCREAPSDEGSRPTDSESGGCRSTPRSAAHACSRFRELFPGRGCRTSVRRSASNAIAASRQGDNGPSQSSEQRPVVASILRVFHFLWRMPVKKSSDKLRAKQLADLKAA